MIIIGVIKKSFCSQFLRNVIRECFVGDFEIKFISYLLNCYESRHSTEVWIPILLRDQYVHDLIPFLFFILLPIEFRSQLVYLCYSIDMAAMGNDQVANTFTLILSGLLLDSVSHMLFQQYGPFCSSFLRLRESITNHFLIVITVLDLHVQWEEFL